MHTFCLAPIGGLLPCFFLVGPATAEWGRNSSILPAAPFILETRTLPGQTHLSAAPEAFRQGLQWLFARPD
jgi:hypothetical protein